MDGKDQVCFINWANITFFDVRQVLQVFHECDKVKYNVFWRKEK